MTSAVHRVNVIQSPTLRLSMPRGSTQVDEPIAQLKGQLELWCGMHRELLARLRGRIGEKAILDKCLSVPEVMFGSLRG
jgi:hypothetical protein